MTLLADPTPGGIRDNLKERLEAQCIYTYIGQVLVAANPFTWLQLYGDRDARAYVRQSRLDVPPHVFAVAEAAFRAMAEEEESQCVIISGESGAGKTEASKHIQSYLALCSAGAGSAEVERVKKVFLESNPLLEAFGNAKTLRNNNSSRFGKYAGRCRDEPEDGRPSREILVPDVPGDLRVGMSTPVSKESGPNQRRSRGDV